MIEATAKEAEAAPEVQDDFDIGEADEATLEVKDRPEVQVRQRRGEAWMRVPRTTPDLFSSVVCGGTEGGGGGGANRLGHTKCQACHPA